MEPKVKVDLTQPEAMLIKLIRTLDYGEVRVIIKDSQPIRAEEVRRSIQLTKDR